VYTLEYTGIQTAPAVKFGFKLDLYVIYNINFVFRISMGRWHIMPHTKRKIGIHTASTATLLVITNHNLLGVVSYCFSLLIIM